METDLWCKFPQLWLLFFSVKIHHSMFSILSNGSEMVGVLASSMVDHGWEIKQVNIHIIHIGSVMASVLASGRSWLSSKEYKISQTGQVHFKPLTKLFAPWNPQQQANVQSSVTSGTLYIQMYSWDNMQPLHTWKQTYDVSFLNCDCCQTLVVIGTDCICSCKSNYYMIITTTALKKLEAGTL
jgi:hypothetical protein